MRICLRCGSKDFIHFPKKRWYACRDCHKRRAAEWRSKNQESKKAHRRKWYLDNLEHSLQYAKDWMKRNPDRARANCSKRRAMKCSATPVWVNNATLLEVYKNCPAGMQVDHIVPLRGRNVCGLHVPWNLQYLTPTENIRKGNRYEHS